MIVFFIGSSAPDIMIGFDFGMFLIGAISHIKGIRAYSKAWKNSTERICKSIYEYKVFDNYISVNIYRENERIRESKCFFTDIEQIQQFGKWLFLQFGGQSFIIRKSDLKENSASYSYMYKNPAKTVDRFYIEIPEADIQGGWKINKYYRIQVRFTDLEAEAIEPGTVKLDTWLSANYEHFSEWSTVCLVRAISTPTLEISGYDMDNQQIVWSLANTQILGKLTFEDEEETDVLKHYQIKLYDTETNTLLSDSGIQYSNNYNDLNSFNYTLPYNFELNKEYYFTIEYLTMANYSKIDTFNFTVILGTEDILDIAITATPDSENGRIGITLKRASTANPMFGTLVIRRSSSKNNFTIWEDLKFFNYPEAITGIKETWYDLTIESDIWYKYCVQLINTEMQRGQVKEMKTPVLVSFEDMFLTVKDRQLKIKFNPQVSSFRRAIQESRTETLGSQYPFVRRNGYMDYAQFSIGGLISFFIDEDQLFITRDKLFGKQLSSYANYNDTNRIDNYNNYIYERKFRDEVIKFLYDENVKLFRSPTEGNFVVKVMDVNLNPTTELGRYLWSFSGTAYEIANSDAKSLQEMGILEGIDS